MATAAQSRANAANAQKSTGPNSPEGKARSRFNALKHGLRCDLDVLPGEDPAEWALELEAWKIGWNPQDAARLRLVEKAARSSWRLARAHRAENAHVCNVTFNAADKFTKKQDKLVRDAKLALKHKPEDAADKFMESYATMNALVAEWEKLQGIAAKETGWIDTKRHHLMLCRLLDHTPEVWSDDPDEIKDVSQGVIHFNQKRKSQSLPSDQVKAFVSYLVTLRGMLDSCVEACKNQRDQYMPTEEMRKNIMDASLLYSGRPLRTLLSYETVADRSLNTALKELRELAKFGVGLPASQLEDEAEESAPVEQAEPIAEASAPAAEPVPVAPEPAEVETNEPKLDITLIPDKPYVSPLVESCHYDTVEPMEFTADGHLTAYCELMMHNRNEIYERERLYAESHPQSDAPAAEVRQADRDRDGRVWPQRD